MAIQWQNLWAGLNERQRHFLRVLYWRECELAAYYASQKAMSDPKKKGAEWRWMRHNGESGLARDLDVGAEDEAALRNNQGSSATYKALEERALIERRWEQVLMFSFAHGEQTVSRLDVRLTPTGRRLVKTVAEGKPAPPRRPRSGRNWSARPGARCASGATPWDWRDAEGKMEGTSVAECRLCGQAARVDAGARKATERAAALDGWTARRGCCGRSAGSGATGRPSPRWLCRAWATSVPPN